MRARSLSDKPFCTRPLSVLNNFLGIFFSEVHSYLPFVRV